MTRVKIIKVRAAYYCDIESLIKKTDTCDNNSKQSFTTKISKHEACGFSIVKKSQLTHIREKNICYRGEDSMKKYCK